LFLSHDNVGDDGAKIYVGNLNFATTQEDLTAAFAAYGTVKDCFLPTDYDGNKRGFAFVSMDEEGAAKAIEELNGANLDGRTLTVNKSLPKGQKASPKRKWD
jgi:RNA recognition motif-containing protein